MNRTSEKAGYTDEFKKDAVSLVLDHGYACKDAAERLGIPKSTMTNWVRKQRNGNNGNTRSQRERDLEAQVRKLEKELRNNEMEREILKKPRPSLRKNHSKIWIHPAANEGISGHGALPCTAGKPERVLRLSPIP